MGPSMLCWNSVCLNSLLEKWATVTKIVNFMSANVFSRALWNVCVFFFKERSRKFANLRRWLPLKGLWTILTNLYILKESEHKPKMEQCRSSNSSLIIIIFFFFLVPYMCQALIIGWAVKSPPANAGDVGSTPGLVRSPGERNGYPLQYSCLEKSYGQRSLAGYSPRGHKLLSD